MTSKNNLNESLKELTEIVHWFDEQKEVDIEAGLDKVKEGAVLIKSCRQRLQVIENEFEEIQKQIDDSVGDL